jgi:[ribosomal protein S5]-alanine N-acetyltransferase
LNSGQASHPLLPERVLSFPVALRPFAAGDAPRVQLLAGEYEVAETTLLIPHPYPEGAALEWIETHTQDRLAGREYTYAITLAGEDLLVGAIALRPAAPDREHIGFWIGRAHWGHGYATAAARTVIALAFSFLDLERVTASHLTRNPASGRVLEKCGLRPLRTERRQHRGAAELVCVLGLTRAAWEEDIARTA